MKSSRSISPFRLCSLLRREKNPNLALQLSKFQPRYGNTAWTALSLLSPFLRPHHHQARPRENVRPDGASPPPNESRNPFLPAGDNLLQCHFVLRSGSPSRPRSPSVR
ncbi:hypothetical protein FF1_015818 [Malus domestica]